MLFSVSYLETAGNRLHCHRATMTIANAAARIYLKIINIKNMLR